MTDTKDKLLELVEEVWKEYPQLRLIQLIMNAVLINGCSRDFLYYCDDHTLSDSLVKFKARLEQNKNINID